jgi:colanic acid biosynthesis glycosyl transferase WcaI
LIQQANQPIFLNFNTTLNRIHAMNILIMAQHYAPEEVSGAVLATELASDLVKKGHQVTFVTSAPSYPLGVVFSGYRNSFLSKETLDGVRIVRIWSYITPNKGFWARSLNFATFSLSSLLGGLAAGRPDVIYSYSPPLPLGLAAWLLSRLYRVPWVLRVEDLFPDAAVAAGVLQNHLAIAFFSALERFLYSKARLVSVLSEGFRKHLLKKHVPNSKISVEPIWADPNLVQPSPKENAFRAEYGLSGKYVILYSGNIGQTSALEEVLIAADILRDEPAFRFLIVGEGIHKDHLIAEAHRRIIDNLQFLPFQPRERFAEMLAAADVTLVTLNYRSSSYSLPGKVFNNMASARPILAVSPPNSELAHLIETEGCGINVPPEDPQAIVAALRMLRADKNQADEMGRLGRHALIERFSRKRCIDQYEALLQSTLIDAYSSD